MIGKLEICHRDRRFVECGDVCNKLQDLGVFVVNLVKATADFIMLAENETDSKMKLTNSVNQTKNKKLCTKTFRRLRHFPFVRP